MHFPPHLLQEYEELLFPSSCLICNQTGVELCISCRPQMKLSVDALDGIPLISTYRYNDELKRILLSAKEDNSRIAQQFIAYGFATSLAIIHASLRAPSYLVIPVPSSMRAIRRRGYIHLERTLRHLVATSPLSIRVEEILRSGRGVRDQTDIDFSERGENVEGKFRVRSAHAERLRSNLGEMGEAGIILVDDVVSTGSSMRESARALAASSLEPDVLISCGLGQHLPSNRMSQVHRAAGPHPHSRHRKRSA